MSDAGAAVLEALRARAIARNKMRAEITANQKNGFDVTNDKLDAWKPYQVTEATLVEKLIAWEQSEGVD